MAATVVIVDQDNIGGQTVNSWNCTVDGATVHIAVSSQTVAMVGTAEFNDYLTCRCYLFAGDGASLNMLLEKDTNGDVGSSDMRNWAALWLAGQVLS